MEVGLYGKLPSHGDFLRRRTSDAFVSVWDAWLQESMAASRSALGERWLDVYLTSPAWRFMGAPGTCGSAPVIGLMVPSVDRVGRYFPLTVVTELPASAGLIAAVTGTAPFFDRAERLVIDTLAAEQVDFESFDERVIRLADDLVSVSLPARVALHPGAAAMLNDDGQTSGWHFPIGSLEELTPCFEQLLSHRLSTLYEPLMVWWTAGSSIVEPSCLIVRGLPHPETFAALLEGAWARHHWQSIPAHIETDRILPDALVEGETPLRVRSAAASDVGRARANNEDAFVERPEIGLWVVADGLGGHSDGEMASRMVCDALADLVPHPAFEDLIDAAYARVQEVNAHLVRRAGDAAHADRSGSTVAVLLVRGTRCVVLWAGDSRVYRWRTGRLEQVTRDHSPGASDPLAGQERSHTVTRAVGIHPQLELDVYRGDVQLGDRFLLCSDGLTRAIPDARLGEWLEREDIGAAVEGLIRTTLDAGAPDNVTVLIAEACT
ncbi:MAG: type VI secretion system-associated protein TagF [Luteitalea sp.]|nr:type VI secretion system-associated protein TagF [Luteitalea sp.]